MVGCDGGSSLVNSTEKGNSHFPCRVVTHKVQKIIIGHCYRYGRGLIERYHLIVDLLNAQ